LPGEALTRVECPRDNVLDLGQPEPSELAEGVQVVLRLVAGELTARDELAEPERATTELFVAESDRCPEQPAELV
jgi:hypothetical protein